MSIHTKEESGTPKERQSEAAEKVQAVHRKNTHLYGDSN